MPPRILSRTPEVVDGKSASGVRRKEGLSQVPVFLRAADTSGVEFIELTKTLNISATGASIASTHVLRPDQVVYMTIPAPSPASSGILPSETPPIAAKVLRQDSAGNVRLLGLEFLRPLE